MNELYNRRTFTKDLDVAKRRLEGMFAGVYSKKYISSYIKKLRAAKPDSKPSIDRYIRKMFKTYNISFDMKAGPDEYHKCLKESKNIPNDEQIKKRFICAMYRMFEKQKSPEDYMERMVNDLVDPELDGDTSVRVKILRQFAKHTDYLADTVFYSPAIRKAVEDELNGDITRIDENFFSSHMKPQKILEPHNELKLIVGCFGSRMVPDDEIDGEIAAILQDEGFEVEDKAQAIAIIPKEINKIKKNSELVNKLLELVKAKKDVIAELYAGSELYEELEKMYREKAHDDKGNDTSAKLLKICNDLAKGNFYNSPKFREALYLFGFAFNMTVFTGSPGECLDVARDFETNIFANYYNNNVLRFLNEEYISGAATAEPTGMGINYCNFVEIVYLYYMKKDDMTPRQKIKSARDTVKKIRSNFTRNKKLFKKGVLDINDPIYPKLQRMIVKQSKPSEYFREKYTQIGELFNRSEDELISYALNSFDIDKRYDNSRGFADNREHKSARKALEKLMDDYEEALLEIYCGPLTITSDINLDVLFSDKTKYPRADEFIRVLNKINDLVTFKGKRNTEETRNRKAVLVGDVLADEKVDVTRTRLLIAFYYVFSWDFLNNGPHGLNIKDMCFEEFYNEFCEASAKYFDKALFHGVSSKNFLDMVLVFSSYAFVES